MRVVEDIEKLKPRLDELQQSLDTTVLAMRLALSGASKQYFIIILSCVKHRYRICYLHSSPMKNPMVAVGWV